MGLETDNVDDNDDGEIAEGRCLLRDAAFRVPTAPGVRRDREDASCVVAGPGSLAARALEGIGGGWF